MATLLKIENLKAAYGGIHALRGVSLEVEEGEIVSVLGANGAGKSTLLKCISAVMKRTDGTIEFDGKPISNKPYEIVEAGLVQVPEARQIFAKLTVEENLRVGAGNRKDPDGVKKDFERVYAMFPRLKERERQYGGLLSGGEQQMLAIARGIMARPKLMMFDEPSLGLAPVIVSQMFESSRNSTRRESPSCSLSRTPTRPCRSPTTPTSCRPAWWCATAPVRSCWRTTPSAPPTSANKPKAQTGLL